MSTHFELMSIYQYFIYKTYIKYEELDIVMNTFYKVYPKYRGKDITIYLDLSSYIEHIFQEVIGIGEHPITFVSAVINYIAHMRNYYKTRYGLELQVIIVYSKNRSSFHTLVNNEWNISNQRLRESQEYKSKVVDVIINQINDIVNYIPNVYIIRANNEALGVVYSTIKKEKYSGNDNLVFIVSRELSLFQIPPLIEGTFCLFKEFTKHKYAVHIIDKKNTYLKYLTLNNRYDPIVFKEGVECIIKVCSKDIRKTKFIDTYMPTEKDKLVYTTPGMFFSLFIGLSGLRSRDIKAIVNWTTALKFIKFFQTETTIEGYDNRSIWMALHEFKKVRKLQFKIPSFKDFDIQMNSISAIYQSVVYDNSPESAVDYHIEMDNYQELKFLNDHVLYNAPMNLEWL